MPVMLVVAGMLIVTHGTENADQYENRGRSDHSNSCLALIRYLGRCRSGNRSKRHQQSPGRLGKQPLLRKPSVSEAFRPIQTPPSEEALRLRPRGETTTLIAPSLRRSRLVSSIDNPRRSRSLAQDNRVTPYVDVSTDSVKAG